LRVVAGGDPSRGSRDPPDGRFRRVVRNSGCFNDNQRFVIFPGESGTEIAQFIQTGFQNRGGRTMGVFADNFLQPLAAEEVSLRGVG